MSPVDDPIGVLTSTKPVVEQARQVRIDLKQIGTLADQLAEGAGAPPALDDDLHFRDGTWKTAGWVLVLDALNFCFWSTSTDPRQRWRVEYRGELYDGYWALAAALRRAVDEGRPIWDPSYLVNLTPRDVAHMLRPYDLAAPEIPLLPLRIQNLHELGRGLLEGFPDRNPVSQLIAECEGSAVCLVAEMTRRFRSFDDVATYDGQAVRFHKRAQIFVADLHGAFAGSGLGAFHDLGHLTAFADYKVPQVLRRFGVIVYEEDLAATVDARRLIPMGSSAEVEIRSATVWACELLRREVEMRGRSLRAFEIDWLLWLAGQGLPPHTTPYHRTYTVYY